MSKVKPITPKEVLDKRETSIPNEVLEAFNDLIVQNWAGNSATIKQEEVAKLAAKKLRCSTEKLFSNNWLDVEGIYRKAGWKVSYDKPGYNETYEAYFIFSKK